MLLLSGCVKLSGNSWYKGPPERPQSMLDYYAVSNSYTGYREEIEATTDDYVWKHITIDTNAGPVVVDYFDTRQKSPNLVFVFPVLGGKLFIEKHIATFFAERGIDAAIVNRNNEFKDPGNFDNLEEIFRQNVIRDRLAIDFFENEQGKSHFGTFGISRGGINVALTAGVDPRLKHNVMVLGGTDLVDLFHDSNQPRIKKYIKSVMEQKQISEPAFFDLLRKSLRTDPKNTAHYIDGRNTLLILGIFDRTVPFTYGMQLRDQIGRPPTVFLLADHYVGLLYTQTISILPPSKEGGLFPFPYIEEEAVTFFRDAFGTGSNWAIYPYRLFQAPLNLICEVVGSIGAVIESAFDGNSSDERPLQESFWESVARKEGALPVDPQVSADVAPLVSVTPVPPCQARTGIETGYP
jgi:hypothetical protein